MDYYGNNDYRNYLAHYGRKGMKKGQHLPGTVWWKYPSGAEIMSRVDAFGRSVVNNAPNAVNQVRRTAGSAYRSASGAVRSAGNAGGKLAGAALGKKLASTSLLYANRHQNSSPTPSTQKVTLGAQQNAMRLGRMSADMERATKRQIRSKAYGVLNAVRSRLGSTYGQARSAATGVYNSARSTAASGYKQARKTATGVYKKGRKKARSATRSVSRMGRRSVRSLSSAGSRAVKSGSRYLSSLFKR